MTLTRRTLLRGLGALLCAPAIVRVSAIMPVKAMPAEMISIVGADVNTWGLNAGHALDNLSRQLAFEAGRDRSYAMFFGRAPLTLDQLRERIAVSPASATP